MEVYRAEELALQSGDVIRWTRNNYQEGYRNGDLGTITVDQKTGSVMAESQNGRQIIMDLSTRHWDHGYVSTVAGSQGRTVERVIYHADSEQIGTSQEAWYVALSRAREEVKVYTDNTLSLKDAVRESRGQSSAMEAVERHLSVERAGEQVGRSSQGLERESARRELQLER